MNEETCKWTWLAAIYEYRTALIINSCYAQKIFAQTRMGRLYNIVYHVRLAAWFITWMVMILSDYFWFEINFDLPVGSLLPMHDHISMYNVDLAIWECVPQWCEIFPGKAFSRNVHHQSLQMVGLAYRIRFIVTKKSGIYIWICIFPSQKWAFHCSRSMNSP